MTSSDDRLFADNQSAPGARQVAAEGTAGSTFVRLVAKVDRRPQFLERIREEYVREPRHSLTLDQARQLFGLEQSTCGQLLDSRVPRGSWRSMPTSAITGPRAERQARRRPWR